MYSLKRFHLIIMPTEKCNFRCVYCYENFLSPKMNSKVINRVKKLIDNLFQEDYFVLFDFFGGEPMVAYDIVKDFMQHAKDKGEFQGRMTTNAYLLNEEKFRELVNLGVNSYEISFDGFRDFHDKVRVTAGRKGTFDVIMRNLENASKTNLDFEIFVRIHLHGGQQQSVKMLIDKLQQFNDDQRFKFFLRPISHLGGPLDSQVKKPTAEEYEEVLSYAKSKLNRLFHMFTFKDEETPFCYAASPRSLVIRSDGSLAKCTVKFDSDLNRVGYLDEEGNPVLDQGKMKFWTRGFLSGDKNALSCPAFGI